MWDMWWTKWHSDRFRDFPLSVSFHRGSMLIRHLKEEQTAVQRRSQEPITWTTNARNVHRMAFEENRKKMGALKKRFIYSVENDLANIGGSRNTSLRTKIYEEHIFLTSFKNYVICLNHLGDTQTERLAESENITKIRHCTTLQNSTQSCSTFVLT
jgi:hypothetical protein